jgi:hypothetical protein
MTITRRQLINSLGIASVGAVALTFQNCSNASFSTVEGGSVTGLGGGGGGGGTGPTPTPNPSPTPNVCNRPLSIFDAPARAPQSVAGIGTVNGVSVSPANNQHDLNATFYVAPFYDVAAAVQKNQYILTVDVGSNPGLGQYNQISSNNTSNINIITDIYVFRNDTGALVLWKQVSASDLVPSAYFLLDPALVAAGAKLTVVCNSIQNGYFGELVDLSQAPVAYSTAVGTFNPTLPFGGSSLHRPYVAVNASGGQNISGANLPLHSPDFVQVSNTEVRVTLGPSAAKHGAYADDHYIAGGMLFDQNGNLLARAAELTRASAANHLLIFSGLDLAGRSVKDLRVVAFDTFNGMLSGFKKVA